MSVLSVFFFGSLSAQNTISFDKYHTNSEVQQIIKNFQQSNPAQIQVHTLATEGALLLAKMLLDSAHYTAKQKWYILPLPNPDAAEGDFSGAKYERSVNDFTLNNDMGEATNEDGSFELWAYYHLGVPSFSMNLFSAPKI